jgi:siroheme synthase-like protein
LFVSLVGKRVLVVGQGRVGLRKAAAAREAGAEVVIDTDYAPEHLSGVHLVFACATEEVNARVVADATARGIWVNAATDPAHGDVVLPAVHCRGSLMIAVSTGGASPSLARRIREKLAEDFDEAFAEWVALLGEMRALVLTTISDVGQRRAILEDLADWRWLAQLRAEGCVAVRTAMQTQITTMAPRNGSPSE